MKKGAKQRPLKNNQPVIFAANPHFLKQLHILRQLTLNVKLKK